MKCAIDSSKYINLPTTWCTKFRIEWTWKKQHLDNIDQNFARITQAQLDENNKLKGDRSFSVMSELEIQRIKLSDLLKTCFSGLNNILRYIGIEYATYRVDMIGYLNLI